MLVLVYVDNCIFFAKKKDDILDMLNKLREAGLEMEPKQDIAGFLGVLIQRKKDQTMELTQSGLTACTISAMGLSYSKSK